MTSTIPHDAPPTTLRLLRGVIFDMDGVLVDSEPFIAEAASRMFAEKGFTVGHEAYRPFVGMGEDRFIGGPAEALGIPLDPVADKARTYAIYIELIKGKLGPLPGVHDFVAECRRRGLAIAVASSADAIKVNANLSAIGLPPDRFDAVVDGLQVARKKPAPDIFLEAARRLNLPPANCLVVEDAIAGVAAAKSAGMRCLGLTTTFKADQLSEADWTAADLAHAPVATIDW
ncbi:HAD-IA family hydrolase [Isosphaeraceae bacterium EP7]